MTDPPAYTIFVNSTDSFEDTWAPFFHLLHDFWPGVSAVLNTERKSYRDPNVDMTCTQVARPGEGRIPWGECVLRALDHIPTETFVYMQDDYFLCSAVNTDVVDEAVRITESDDLDCLRLMECGGAGPYEPTPYPWLCSVSRLATYRISLQAGLWTKTGIRKYLRSHESPWEMEVWGSKRAARIDGRIWAVNRDVFSEEHTQVIPYEPTGIVRGQWKRDVVEDLFAVHGIDVPFEVRGWLPATGPTRSTVAQKIRKAPKYAWDRIRSF
ncbi:MAG: hypothetical protein P4L93_06940 [Coriobacteriia bacterium]|nr:hypothetical protein [Coriobacteriia bacterium]